MTQSDTSPSQSQHSYRPDDVDLSQYLDVLILWWKEILFIACVTAALVVLTLMAKEWISIPRYRANADVVIALLASDITLDERVTTVVDELSGNNMSDSYRSALVSLGESGEIAEAVAKDLGSALSAEQQKPGVLMSMVDLVIPTSRDTRTSSNLIRIEATANSPELASMIANSWAEQFIQKVNLVYGQVPPDVLESLDTELVAADEAFQTAQRNLEVFLADNQIDTLNRQITEQEEMHTALQTERAKTLALIIEADQNARRAILSSLTEAQLDALLNAFEEQVRARTNHLYQLYTAQTTAQLQLDQAQNLLSQIVEGGDASIATNSIALQLLKAQVFSSVQNTNSLQTPGSPSDQEAETSTSIASEVRLPADLLFSGEMVTHASADEQRQDVSALVKVLERYLEDIESRIVVATEALVNGDSYELLDELDVGSLGVTGNSTVTGDIDTLSGIDTAILDNYSTLFEVGGLLESSQASALEEGNSPQQVQLLEIEKSLQKLRSKLAAEQARELYLTQQHDLTWNTFDALSNKSAELGMKLSSANRQVRMGSMAIPPSSPIKGRNILPIGALSFAFGLLLGVLIAFLYNYLGYRPFFSRRTQTT